MVGMPLQREVWWLGKAEGLSERLLLSNLKIWIISRVGNDTKKQNKSLVIGVLAGEEMECWDEKSTLYCECRKDIRTPKSLWSLGSALQNLSVCWMAEESDSPLQSSVFCFSGEYAWIRCCLLMSSQARQYYCCCVGPAGWCWVQGRKVSGPSREESKIQHLMSPSASCLQNLTACCGKRHCVPLGMNLISSA